MPIRLIIAGAVLLGSLVVQAQQATSPQNSITQAAAKLREGQAQQAFDLLTASIAQDPDNAATNLLAASAAIALSQPEKAVAFAERARTLEPDNWKVRTSLVTAYAMAGKVRERDAERTALRELHTSGKVAEAAQTSGFLLDLFKARNYSVEAVEYFTPVGKFHIYFRFNIRNAQGQRVWQIDVQSDDYNQASWAKAYPKQAGEGQRQFQITGEGDGVRADYRTFSGSPDYDWIKARIVDILNAQVAPFPGEVGPK